MGKEVVAIAGKDPFLQPGGLETYVRAYALAARRAGYEPHLFCVSTRTEVVETEWGIVHRIATPFRPIRSLMVPLHAPLLVSAVRRFLHRRPGPHLIHGFGAWGWVGAVIHAHLQREERETIPVVTIYTTLRHETIAKRVGLGMAHPWLEHIRFWFELAWIRLVIDACERRCYRRARLVFVNYDSVRDIVTAECGRGIQFKKMTYAPESAFRSDPFRQPLPPPPIAELQPADAPLVVAISRQDPRKGLDVLLRALSKLRDDAVPFRACLVGGGDLLAAHRELANSLGLTKNTALVGRVPNVAPYLSHGDIFVLPSLEEGSGSVAMLEAMQAGLALVATRIDGIPEDVSDEQNGLLAAAGDPSSLAGVLRRVLTDAGLRTRLRRQARLTYERRFTALAFSKDLAETYAQLGYPATDDYPQAQAPTSHVA